MTVKLRPLPEPPPATRYRTGAIGEAEARAAVNMLEEHEWVSDGHAHHSRPAAAHRAKRLLHYLHKLDAGTFTSKTWAEGRHWRWAVRRTDMEASK